MKTILATTDFSPRSHASLDRGALLSAQLGTELIYLHVMDDDTVDRLPGIRDGSADRTLQALAEKAGARWKISSGSVPQAIHAAAESSRADLIILGPPGRRTLREAITGTTAEKTIRHSDVPVLMTVTDVSGPYRNILLATDFSDASLKAAETLKSTGLLGQAGLTVLNVFEAPAIETLTRAPGTTEQLNQYIQSEGEKARQSLLTYIRRTELQTQAETVEPLLKLMRASAGRTICDAATEIGADLVVVGTHAKMGLARFVLGSVAEEVLRLSGSDVLAVPPKERG